MKNDDKMGTKNILPLLVEFSIPAIIGMLVNAIYNIVDRMFIGNAPELGAIGLAGISICYPVTLVLMAISLMIGMGGATRFSIALGQGKKEEAGKYMGNGLTLTIILGLVFMILGNVFLAPMLRLLGASKTVLPYAENYLSIILYGAVFQCIAMAGNNFSRAQGNPKNAMISQLIGAGFNILFDYILICIFHMGMQGAAFATIGGQFLSALWQLAFLFGKRTIIPLNATLLKLQLNISKQIIQTVDSDVNYSWHCGDGHGKYGITNQNSLGIEICIEKDGNPTEATLQSTLELIKFLMKKYNISINNVVRHYDASRKKCPKSFMKNNWCKWYEFKRTLCNS